MYRAETKDGRVVMGYHAVVEGRHWIIDKNAYIKTIPTVGWGARAMSGFVEVLPSTLAQSTGIRDKHGVEIFSSFEVDGKMSEGGDRVQADSWQFHVIWQKYGWGLLGVNRGWWRQFTDFENIEVIPKEQQ